MTPDGDLMLGDGAVTTIVCAGYDFDREVAPSLRSVLPPVLHVPANPVQGAKIAAVVAVLVAELGTRDAGARAAVARLIDLLLIQAVRAWSASAAGASRPGCARSKIPSSPVRLPCCTSARPSRDHRGLAAELHLSRATLARRFAELVGEPPLTYLTRWRMDLAARRLKDTTEPVEAIAHAVGYMSEYAFNRAFSRHRGQPPGRYRRAA